MLCLLYCTGVCNTFGSMWYRSYDNFEFTFQNDCKYVLTKHCSSKPGHVPKFTVIQKTGTHPGSRYLRTVGLELHLDSGESFKMENGSVLVGDMFFDHVMNMPQTVRRGQLELVRSNHSHFDVYAFGRSGKYSVQLHLSERGKAVDVVVGSGYFNETCGLCGSWNSNPHDDTYLTPWSPEGRMRTDRFVRSYRNATCRRLESFSEKCSYNVSRTSEALELCSMIGSEKMAKVGAFRSCYQQAVKGFVGLLEMCLKEACICLESGQKSKAWCQCKALQRAASVCRDKVGPPEICSKSEDPALCHCILQSYV